MENHPNGKYPLTDQEALRGYADAARKEEQARQARMQGASPSAQENEARKAQREYERLYADTLVPPVKLSTVNGKIGEGRHSVVYKGERAGTQELVIIKIDERNLLDVEHYLAVKAKIAALKGLKHHNIARLLDYIPDWENKRSFIVMEYVDGEGLHNLLFEKKLKAGGSKGKPLFSQAEVLDWGCQMLDALMCLHGRKQVHGDIDLANIIRRQDGSICLIDFDLAAVSRDLSAEETSAGKSHQKISEPGKDAVDSRSDRFGKAAKNFQEAVTTDIYHIGAAMFQLLTGRVPDPKRNKLREGARSDDEKPLLREEKKSLLKEYGVSPNLIEIILKATDTEREKRYQSAREMLNALIDLPLQDRRVKRGFWRNFAAFAASLLILVAGIAFRSHGIRLETRMEEMRKSAALAEKEMKDGKFSDALFHALDATGPNPSDPLCPPEAQQAIAEILGTYHFGADYYPFLSISDLLGEADKLRFSPDGEKLAVLVEATPRAPYASRIQIFETSTGKELPFSPLSVNGTLRDFVFRDDNTLIYSGVESLTALNLATGAEVWRGTPIPAPPQPAGAKLTALSASLSAFEDAPSGSATSYLSPASIALSANRARLAALYPGEQTARLYDTYTGKERAISLDMPYASNETPAGSDKVSPQRLFALDKSGQYLAVSFSNGEARIYNLNDESDAPAYWRVPLNQSFYRHFEGGFIDGYFLCAASGFEERTERVLSECKAFSTVALFDPGQEGKPLLERSEYELIHAKAEGGAIILSIGQALYHVDLTKPRWGPIGEMDGETLFLDYAPSDPARILAISEHSFMVSENDSMGTLIPRTAPYWTGCVSERHMAMSARNSRTVSVFRQGPPEYAERILQYDASYAHDSFGVRTGGTSAILFRRNGFCVFWADRDAPYLREFPDWENIRELKYLRKPETEADPQTGECLKVTYSDKVVYYSAETGQEDVSKKREQATAKEYRMAFALGDYRVEGQPGASVRIYGSDSEEPLKTWENAQLCSASQYEGGLLVALSEIGGENRNARRYYSLLLDENLNEIAEMDAACEVLPDGTLFADDYKGNLIRSGVKSLPELRDLAKNALNRAENGGLETE